MSIPKIYKKRYFFFVILLICGSNTFSQKLFTSIFAGSSNYSGDLQEKFFTLNQSRPAIGVGLLYEINDKMLIRGDFTYGNLNAHDKYGSKNKARNLSFYSNITEYSLCYEYTLLNLYQYRVSPYLFTGIALFDFNPYTKTEKGNIVFLAELNTEGQGFYNGRKIYKLKQYSIPIGGGIQWAINDNKRIGIVFGFRKTFTDYLDDVSTTFVDETILALNRGQKAADIAYRGDELPNGAPYPSDGSLRGSAKSKDWYYFTGLTFRIRIAPGKRVRTFRYDREKSKKSSLKCPSVF